MHYSMHDNYFTDTKYSLFSHFSGLEAGVNSWYSNFASQSHHRRRLSSRSYAYGVNFRELEPRNLTIFFTLINPQMIKTSLCLPFVFTKGTVACTTYTHYISSGGRWDQLTGVGARC